VIDQPGAAPVSVIDQPDSGPVSSAASCSWWDCRNAAAVVPQMMAVKARAAKTNFLTERNAQPRWPLPCRQVLFGGMTRRLAPVGPFRLRPRGSHPGPFR